MKMAVDLPFNSDMFWMSFFFCPCCVNICFDRLCWYSSGWFLSANQICKGELLGDCQARRLSLNRRSFHCSVNQSGSRLAENKSAARAAFTHRTHALLPTTPQFYFLLKVLWWGGAVCFVFCFARMTSPSRNAALVGISAKYCSQLFSSGAVGDPKKKNLLSLLGKGKAGGYSRRIRSQDGQFCLSLCKKLGWGKAHVCVHVYIRARMQYWCLSVG